MKVAILLLFSAMAAAQVPHNKARVPQVPQVPVGQLTFTTPMISTEPGCTNYGPQDKHLPNVPDCKAPFTYVITTATQSGFYTSPISTEVITKNGHYRWTFDDPDNVYRCMVVSVVDPHNVFKPADAFMIACYRKHEPEKEK